MDKLKGHLSIFGKEEQELLKRLVMFEEKTKMHQQETSVSESVTSTTGGATAPVVQPSSFRPCGASEALGLLGEPLGLGPKGKPPSRVSGD